MAGRKTLAIPERQFTILQVLWQHGPQTVRELMEHLPRGPHQPYTTVLGALQHMEKAGLVRSTREGAVHRYEALVTRQAATRRLLSDFVGRFFGGSARALVLGLVDADALKPADLQAIEEQLKTVAKGPDRQLEGPLPRASRVSKKGKSS